MRILILLLFSVTMYGQTLDRNKVIVRESLRFGGTNPAPNKILRSIDLMGNLEYIYLTDLQDSLNTGIYDTIDGNVIIVNSIRVNRDSFTEPAANIASIGDSGFVVECAATCEDIRWTTNDSLNTILRVEGNVGIGTTSPTAKLEVSGGVTIVDAGIDSRIGAFVIDSFKIDIGITNQGGDTSLVFSYAPVGTSNTNLNIQTQGGHIVLQEVNNNVGIGTSTPTKKLHVAGTSLFTDTITYQNGTQADGYVLTSDINGNATWQDPTAYGEMGFGDSLSTIAITQNVFSVVTNSNNTLWSTAAVDLHNVTYSGDSLIIDSAGTYQVNIQLSMDGTNGSVIRLGVFLNGVLACSCTGYEELSSNRVIQLNYINIDQLSAGDVLQVVVTNTASNDDVDVVAGKITINKIR